MALLRSEWVICTCGHSGFSAAGVFSWQLGHVNASSSSRLRQRNLSVVFSHGNNMNKDFGLSLNVRHGVSVMRIHE